MSYVLSVIHPPVPPAAFGKAEVLDPVPVPAMAYGHMLHIAASHGLLPSHEAGDQLTEVLASMRPGEEWVHESGLAFRIDDADTPPNVCPCCGRLVAPEDAMFAGEDDTLCDGCYTWARTTPQCLPANTAHTKDPA